MASARNTLRPRGANEEAFDKDPPKTLMTKKKLWKSVHLFTPKNRALDCIVRLCSENADPPFVAL